MNEKVKLALAEALKNTHPGNKETINPNQKRRKQLADWYSEYYRAENISSALRRFGELETAAEIRERAKLTDADNPAVFQMLEKWLDRGMRTEPQVEGFLNEINGSATSEWLNESEFKHNIENIYSTYSNIDPNLFISIRYDLKDGLVIPYIKKTYGEDVIDLVYHNEQLEAAILRDGDTVEVIMPFESLNVTVTASNLRGSDILTIPDTSGTATYMGRSYEFTYYTHKIPFTPGSPLGYIDDIDRIYDECGAVTGRYENVFVSPFHPALEMFRGLLQKCSERDLAIYLHCFPQVTKLIPKCLGEPGKGCHTGLTNEGSKCRKCNGTGMMRVSNAMRQIEIEVDLQMLMVGNGQVPDLSKMINYADVPTASLEYYDRHITELIQKIYQTIFGISPNEKTGGAETATKVEFTTEGILDVVWPFVRNFDRDYSLYVTAIASLFDELFDGNKYLYIHSKELKIKSREELSEELKTTTDPNVRGAINQQLAGLYVVNKTDSDIVRHLYKLYNVFNLDDNERRTAMASGYISREDIWVYFNSQKVVLTLGKDLNWLDYSDQVKEKKILDFVTANVPAVQLPI